MKLFKLAIVTVSMLLLSSCAIYHHYAPYYGIVVDVESKTPLEGAVVLVYYSTWMYISPGGPVGYFLDAQETITDKKGEFKISSLNAFAFRPLSTFNSEPDFIIFKPGYACSGERLFQDQYDWVQLRQLRTRKERLNNLDCTPTIVPNNKMMKLRKLQDVERIDLGLQPVFRKKEQK